MSNEVVFDDWFSHFGGIVIRCFLTMDIQSFVMDVVLGDIADDNAFMGNEWILKAENDKFIDAMS